MLFAGDAAVATHTQQELQSMISRFSQACTDFRLTNSLKKTNIMGQDTEATPVITNDDHELDVVWQDQVSNADGMSCAEFPIRPLLLCLGRVHTDNFTRRAYRLRTVRGGLPVYTLRPLRLVRPVH